MNREFSINLDGKLIDLSQPTVMGIVNITDDSFFSESRATSRSSIAKKVTEHIENGVTFIDIGGYSTRPNAEFVSTETEIERVNMALEVIENEVGKDINLSIDTFRSEVVESVLDKWGASFIVNDVEAAENDKKMLEIVGKNSLPYIAMHSKGNPQTMDSLNQYNDIVNDILKFFVRKIELFHKYEINDYILDVGFGFAKNIEQNFEILRRYKEFDTLGAATLAGISRKRMIWQTLNSSPQESLNGTTIINTMLLERGANILRVHDSKEAMECIKLYLMTNK